LAEQVWVWADDEREKMRMEQERSLESSHVVDGGGATHQLERLEDLVDLERQGGGLVQLVESRPYLEVDWQHDFNVQARLGFKGDSMEIMTNHEGNHRRVGGTVVKKGHIGFAYHVYPGFTSARHLGIKGRSRFTEFQG
jgi:hypothetical protein